MNLSFYISSNIVSGPLIRERIEKEEGLGSLGSPSLGRGRGWPSRKSPHTHLRPLHSPINESSDRSLPPGSAESPPAAHHPPHSPASPTSPALRASEERKIRMYKPALTSVHWSPDQNVPSTGQMELSPLKGETERSRKNSASQMLAVRAMAL